MDFLAVLPFPANLYQVVSPVFFFGISFLASASPCLTGIEDVDGVVLASVTSHQALGEIQNVLP